MTTNDSNINNMSLYILYMHCVCIVYVLCMHCVCIVYTIGNVILLMIIKI